MKQLLCSLLLTCAVACSAQAYNPDVDGDGIIAINDMLALLSQYGLPPEQVLENCVLEMTEANATGTGSNNGQITSMTFPMPLCDVVTLIPEEISSSVNISVQMPDGLYHGQRVTILNEGSTVTLYCSGDECGNGTVIQEYTIVEFIWVSIDSYPNPDVWNESWVYPNGVWRRVSFF